MKKRLLSLTMCLVMLFLASATLIGCSCGGKKPEALVIMSDELDGLFNPFYSTTSADNTIVGMTQIAMLTSGVDANGDAVVAFGDDHAVVVKDYKSEYNSTTEKTTYTFVIKNGIRFSDGQPLTIEDVLFNMYVYLDPGYTGSSTLYSTSIEGLQSYRVQQLVSDDGNEDTQLTASATAAANDRINELVNLFLQELNASASGSVSIDSMKNAINNATLSSGYINAITNNPATVSNINLMQDFEKALAYFKEELGTDYASYKEAYVDNETFQNAPVKFDEILSFMYAEGFVDVEYAIDPETGKKDKNKIEKVTPQYNTSVVKDKDSAIDYVYNQKVTQELHMILNYWATAQKLLTEYTAKAKEVILYKDMKDGELLVPNIKGIVSLGHTSDVSSVTIGDNTYAVAHAHNDDGTPQNANEYDVLQVTINDVDPKAIWNFAFTVAPQHYYAPGYTVDIANNEFGLKYSSAEFHSTVLQSDRNTKVPMGAGAYVATNSKNEDNPKGADFYRNNVVYFKANTDFMMGEPKIQYIRYQVVSAANALGALKNGEVHYITPQFTNENIAEIDSLKASGKADYKFTDQLGYGYIGINAGKVPNINLRKAIMSAMNTELSLSYYRTGMAEKIYWPMSTVSWAYPEGDSEKFNNHDYPAINFNRDTAKTAILNYMSMAGVSEGDSQLKLTFTIAGSKVNDHPTYSTFQAAAELLNECGWDVEVVPDSQALTKISTGGLAVWAAAWGTTVDPDMYQVYHKNSKATSTTAWGYNAILASPDKYPEEIAILNALSDLIDDGRETEDRDTRREIYEEAMGKVLDLAIELPVYQRKVLYVYNSNVIKTSSLPSQLNPYTSPLDRIWEVEFAD